MLDARWAPAIAVQLRGRGHDVVSAQEAQHASRYRSISDETLFVRAQEDRRVGTVHHGVVYCSYSQFDRGNPRIAGRLVAALDAFLRSETAALELFNQRHWLRPA